MQNLVKDQPTGGMWANFDRAFFVFFTLCLDRTARLTATSEGSKCVCLAKEVPEST